MRTRIRRRALLTSVAAGVLLAGANGCGAFSGDRPNIVLILVDQLRADAVAKWMPETNTLSERGVVFENMRSAAPWTYPSVVSMFSGLYPQQHGADGAPDNSNLLSTFSENVPLLPSLLSDDYYTAGFVTNPFLQTWNPIHAGFDYYAVDEFIGDQGPTRGNAKAVWTEHMFSDSVNAAVLEHFDARTYAEGSEPEFTYVHYIDVHGPWDGAPFDAGGADHRRTEDAAYAIAARYVDQRIKELYDYFLARYEGDVVFVVTSDHGQELGDDLDLGNGPLFRQRKATVHDFNTRIPFLVLPSTRVEAPRRVAEACSNVDIAPTLLDWAGEYFPSDIPGISLLPAIHGEALDTSRAIYSIHSAFNRRNDCAVIGGKKLMRHFDPKDPQGPVPAKFVYDVAADPRESEVIATTFGPDGTLLMSVSQTNGYEYPKDFRPPDADTLEHLQAIGYLGGDE